MPFGRDSCVAPSNIVLSPTHSTRVYARVRAYTRAYALNRGHGPLTGRGDLGSEPQFAAMSPIAKLLGPSSLQVIRKDMHGAGIQASGVERIRGKDTC